MRFIIDECTGPFVSKRLAEMGHNTVSVFDSYRGIADERVLQLAWQQERILITNDKDFGEKVYRDGIQHHGIVLLRLENERGSNKVAVLTHLFE